jgi:hypothetical protein
VLRTRLSSLDELVTPFGVRIDRVWRVVTTVQLRIVSAREQGFVSEEQ